MSTLAPEKTAPASAQAGSPAAAPVEAVPAATHEVPVLSRAQQAQALVNSYVPWSVAAGLIPVPMFDMAALMSVQLRMLDQLAKMYSVPFMENGVKTTVSSLIGTVLSANIGAALGSLVKTIPIVGAVAGAVMAPAAYSAVTYAIGRVFVAHFESGGTFLDFDADEMRAFFVAEYEKAKSAVKPAGKAV